MCAATAEPVDQGPGGLSATTMAAAAKADSVDPRGAIDKTSVLGRVTFSWVAPIIQKGWTAVLDEEDARFLVPQRDDAVSLAEQFNQEYERKKAKRLTRGIWNTTTRTLLSLYFWQLLYHSFWVAVEVGVRLVSPVALRGFLTYLSRESLTPNTPDWPGWLWALFVASGGVAMTIIHHQFFWVGMRIGFTMRQQVVAAIHQKVLRLNSASVVHANTGHIVNLASNDVRRFDDAVPFWLFIWAAPLETAAVLLMVSLELGFVPAICGVGACLSVMPLQSLLVRTVAGLRRNTARKTDERVRLTGEVIQGALAMKMLGWEDPFTAAICKIRSQEVQYAGRMAQIRGLNLALQFAMTPVAAFTTFAVYFALGGTLTLPSVFYVLSLLHLPKLYQVYFFVLGVQYLTELKISLQRIDDFLSMKEPPPPVFQRTAAKAARAAAAAAAAVAAAGGSPGTGENGTAGSADVAIGTVQLRGADYDWAQNLQMAGGGAPDKSNPIQPEASTLSATTTAELAKAAAAGAGPTLKGIQLDIAPGELLGVAGEVGSGKSSLLAALLGELQPARNPDGSAAGDGPVVRGRVGYCSQVPWIMAATLKDNILFGAPPDKERYAAVVEAAALGQDLAELPAGDETELGERGINLSGGQKARVALARAAFSQADVQLLDDPLSAVDPRVGRILFDKCIGPQGVMAGSTRVLVTHQRQYLPRCDRVAVLRGGRLVALGTWEQLAPLQLPELVAGAAVMEHFSDEDEVSSSRPGTPPLPVSTPTTSAAAGTQPPDAVAVSLPALGSGLTEVAATEAAAAAAGPTASSTQPLTAPGSTSSSSSGSGDIKGRVIEGVPKLSPREDADDVAAFAVTGKADSGHFDRVRTMPPDVNRRPADSGRPSADDGGDAKEGPLQQQVAPRAFLSSMSRAISRVWSSTGLAAAAYLRNKSYRDGLPRPASAASVVAGQLVKAERREVGGVDWQVYGQYCVKVGVLLCAPLSLLLLAGQACFLAAEWWLALWAASPPAVQQQARWLQVYGALVALLVVVSLLRAAMFFQGTLSAATAMHNGMVGHVLGAPLSFFHTNPAGRILNRFSNDQGRVDDQLPMALFDVLQTGFQCLGAFILVSIAVPFILPVFLPLVIAFYMLRQRYITTSREVKRWEATTRSPVYASFSATLKGLPTIRAYSAEGRFHATFLNHLSLNGSWWYAFISTARWIGFRLDVIAATTLTAGVLLAMAIHSRVSAAVLALALTHVLQLTGMLQWWVRQTAEVENTMTSVERLLEYTRLPQEPPRVSQGGGAPPPGWPKSGSLEYRSVTASYRPGLPSVLRDLSFSLPGGCSCGVVGRTGSGKSSLMLTLFRLIDINAGSIFLDGVDTSTIGLDALRSQLAIIPQDPVLFSGTLRSNLGPWSRYQDAQLWEVLGKVQLKGAIAAAGGLTAPMAECGDNLSVGQRQLFCLARALLQRAKVLALDEATANVDRATDALIQQALREFAHGSSEEGHVLLVIAHRIDTIMDCDQLLVLSNGALVEAGAPGQLAAQPGGMFAGMVEAAKAAAATAPEGKEQPPQL